MKRVWVVDDQIPMQLVYGAAPVPASHEREMMQHLLAEAYEDAWEEPQVRKLCASLCDERYEPLFFRSPDSVRSALRKGAVPPHAVIFDWEGAGFSTETNLAALQDLLDDSLTYVQVYTHLAVDSVEPKLKGLRSTFGNLVLQTRTKDDVEPEALARKLAEMWEGTIAGSVADEVRNHARRAVERALVDLSSVSRSMLSALVDRDTELLLDLVLARVREDISAHGNALLREVAENDKTSETSDELRRLLSIWYYFFPGDDRVRRGDLVELDNGDLGLIVTPPCDLARFKKKTGSRLTWVRALPLCADNLKRLKDHGITVDRVGTSSLATHGKAGNRVVVIPNVPRTNDRSGFDDYIILAHAWESRICPGIEQNTDLRYNVIDFTRRCTLVEPIAAAVTASLVASIASTGSPEFPSGEASRLTDLVKEK